MAAGGLRSEAAAQRPPLADRRLDSGLLAQRIHEDSPHCSSQQVHHVRAVVHIRRSQDRTRVYCMNAAAVALALLALSFVTMQGPRRTALESEGMKEYNLAQAKAVLASDEVEVRNSKRRLSLIKDKLDGAHELSSDSGMEQEGLSNLLLNKAEDYELEADVSAAKVAKVKLHNKSLPKLAREQASINEDDDKLYARALRRAAQRDSPTNNHLEHMHLYLQQYGSKTSLKVGKAKEEYFLRQAEDRMVQDRKHLEILLANSAKRPTKPATQVDAEEQEAMAIEAIEH